MQNRENAKSRLSIPQQFSSIPSIFTESSVSLEACDLHSGCGLELWEAQQNKPPRRRADHTELLRAEVLPHFYLGLLHFCSGSALAQRPHGRLSCPSNLLLVK